MCQPYRTSDSVPSADESGNLQSAARPPIGVHLGVVCDKTLNVITGFRYTRKRSKPSYDLCQAEFLKLLPEEQLKFERIAPPVTPRRTAIGLGVGAIAAAAISMIPQPQPFYDDYIETPELSPAEALVGFFFRPNVRAAQREAAPTAPRRLQFVSPASAEGCDEACKQRIADRRALFEQSRTTNDRQKILDLSRQRAALYNTTFQGASCIPGIPCL